jgi:hypothetical protein
MIWGEDFLSCELFVEKHKINYYRVGVIGSGPCESLLYINKNSNSLSHVYEKEKEQLADMLDLSTPLQARPIDMHFESYKSLDFSAGYELTTTTIGDYNKKHKTRKCNNAQRKGKRKQYKPKSK